MPAGRATCRRTGGAGVAAVERLERRSLCAANAPGVAAVAGASTFSQLLVRGDVGTAGDEDWFALGRLHAGDVISLTASGRDSGRGTLADPTLRLFRKGANLGQLTLVAADTDGGTGFDALVLGQPLPADDLYFVLAKGAGTITGTYELSAWLESAAGAPGAGAGPGASAEAEPNGDAAPQDVSGAWGAARLVSSRDVTLAPDGVDDQALPLLAGDVVSVLVDSTSALDAAVSVGDEGGATLAVDRGDSNRRAGDVKDAFVFAYCAEEAAVYHVKVWSNAGTSGTCRVTVYVSRPAAAVVGRQVFYNDSAYDGRTAGASPADDAAVATDKAALRPGQAATLANVTNCSAGINGIFVDVKGLRRELTADDFDFAMSATGGSVEWVAAPTPATISRRAGAGVDGSDRVTLIWPNGSIVNRWLRVTVKAREDNDFAADDVFYFGNLAGETGDESAGATVTANDVLRTRARLARPTSLADWFDFNRDGRVNALDQAIGRANFSRNLVMFTAAPPPAAAFSEATIIAVPLRHVQRRSGYDLPSSLLG